MHIPHTISSNTINAYKINNRKSKSILNSEDFSEWHYVIPKRLNVMCLEIIVANWADNPVLNELTLDQDIRFVLDNLSTDLPYKIIKLKISDSLYWKRCYLSRWPNKLPAQKPVSDRKHCKFDFDRVLRKRSSLASIRSILLTLDMEIEEEIGRSDQIIESIYTWKHCFLETHLQQALENLNPQDYNPEEVKELIDLCYDYVRTLKLNQLVAGTQDCKDHIPLNAIISGLPLLTELSLCFKQTYAGEQFSWHILQLTNNDIINLAKGLEKCSLQKFRIINSDLDCEKLILLINGLIKNKDLKTLEFSHCKISNKGTMAMCKLLLELPTLDTLILCNNFIESEGLEALSCVIKQPKSKLKKLDLRLNNIGVNGGNYLATALANGANYLEHLKVAGCKLNNENLLLIKAIKFNSCLKTIDLSNNKFNEEVGKYILQVLDKNITIRKIDVRMCGIPPHLRFSIEDKLLSIRKLKNKLETPDKIDCFPVFDEEKILSNIRSLNDIPCGMDDHNIEKNVEEVETEALDNSIPKDIKEEIIL